MLFLQLYEDQNIAVSSFVTVDKYQHYLKITSITIKFSKSISRFDILFSSDKLHRVFLVVFDLTWKLQIFRAKKYFLKQCCAQDGMLQLHSQHFLAGKKVGNIGPFLTNFSHKLEHHSWYGCHLWLHKKHAERR